MSSPSNLCRLTVPFKSPASSAAPSWRQPGMPIPTPLTRTPSCGPTTWPSSSAVAAPSNEVARCNLRCTMAAPNFSSTSSSLYATMSMTFPVPSKFTFWSLIPISWHWLILAGAHPAATGTSSRFARRGNRAYFPRLIHNRFYSHLILSHLRDLLPFS